MSSQIRLPNIQAQGDRAQLAQIRSYLYQLSADLQHALSHLGAENFASDSTARQVLSGGMSGEQKETLERGLGNLKSLIIKTSDAVQAEMQVLETSLESKYVAVSDFGAYQEDIAAQLTATAASIEQAISYYAALSDALGGVSDEFEAYTVEVAGYIRQGIIGYEDAVPVIGIAIGRDLTVTGAQETVDGTTYDVIDTSSNMSVWTPDKLAFYINGAEAAYFSNGALYVGTVIVQTKLVIGQNKWQIDHANGLSIKWIGA